MYACISCNNSTNCFACSTNTYLTGISAGNNSCSSCSLGCSTCLSATNCTNCDIGYYLDTILDVC